MNGPVIGGSRQAIPIPGSTGLLGEGPCWDSTLEAVWWVDVDGHAVRSFDASTGLHQSFPAPGTPTAVLPAADGRVLVAVDRACYAFDALSGSFDLIVGLPEEPDTNRTNDAKCDARGRIWIGTMDRAARDQRGSLYRIDPDRTVHRVLAGISISNGLAWSADGRRMFFVDSASRRVDVCAFDIETGTIQRRAPLYGIDPSVGEPDGMAIDSEDGLWVAIWGGGAVWRIDTSSGRVVDRIAVASARVSSCAFGGSELLELYITSAGLDGGLGPCLHVAGVAVPGARVGKWTPR